MNKDWTKVFMAGFIEVIWVAGLKYSDSWLEWLGTIITICISFYLLISASKRLPVSTVYAVFTGLGAAGTVIAEILFFNEPFQLVKILLIAVLVCGVIGLKTLSDDKKEEASI
ncbi:MULTISPECIES: DMT family transporter [Metabacillus]|uniref:DMT family transporter n=1 Tax=Metabacillus indicus TaxID=246786 RepID=UPI00248FB365|nr:multidrug efflux SMR transporter [Metabacillus indicus]